MNTEWNTFLQNRGVSPSAEQPDAGCSLVDLGTLGLVHITGEDAAKFLQSQFSQDVDALSRTTSALGSLCTPKGRMLALFRTLLSPDGSYRLLMPRERVEALVRRLSMFVLRSKVVVTDASDALARFGVWGPEAANRLTAAGLALPESPDGVEWTAETAVIRIPGPHPRYLLNGPVEAASTAWAALEPACTVVSPDAWARQDVLAGLPTVYDGTSEEFVPQMANLELVGGVSFKKGCYPGQEIVARMQYLGKLKRRMYRVYAQASERPEPGTDLFSAADTSGQSSGKIVDARPSPEGGYDMLAVTKIAAAEEDQLRLGQPGGPEVSLRALPYDFPQPDD